MAILQVLRSLAALLIVLVLAATTFGPGISSVLAGENRPAIGDTTIFASVPAPGHPFGVAVDKHRIYISTSAGDFFTSPPTGGHLNSDGERVFAYDEGGALVKTTSIATMPNSNMGLFGLALDGNRGPNHQLYVADMNGRILRLSVDQKNAVPELFAQVPPQMAGGWMVSMWNDLVFDSNGNLFMTDDKPRLWRVTPDGQASIWFQDPRLTGFFGFAGGPLGGRIDPTGKFLYFSITVSATFPGEGVVYRLPLVEHPSASDLQVVHRFPVVPGQAPPQATGIAFAASGNLYVALIGTNQVAVLDPAGNEIRRISSPLFDSPWGLAFMGQSLLVTNADIQPVESPDRWKVLRVFVGESGLPLNRPRTSGKDGNPADTSD
ncbi:MAG TPA: SMP-30/gluconolactonase/LRE family protein [Candidatus Limnocylindrales bacterium]|nr:SMP-30/gluconolactonase/LRE family protein [Candidatus Limnocylindrales bacterium]